MMPEQPKNVRFEKSKDESVSFWFEHFKVNYAVYRDPAGENFECLMKAG